MPKKTCLSRSLLFCLRKKLKHVCHLHVGWGDYNISTLNYQRWKKTQLWDRDSAQSSPAASSSSLLHKHNADMLYAICHVLYVCMVILRNTQTHSKVYPRKKYRNKKQRLRQLFISFPKKKIRKRKNVRDRSQQDFGSLIIWTAGNDNMHTHT